MTQGNRVAIITGGGQGIGKAIAKRMLKEGATVVLAEIDVQAGQDTAKEFQGMGRCAFIQTNVSGEDSVQNTIAETIQQFGHIDVLVNNAAINRPQPISHLSLEEWNQVIGTNLTGPFLMTKFAEKHLRHSKGVVVNIASTRAMQSEPNTEAYSASKGGLVALTHALAASLSPDVRVNCISPGWIETGEWKKPGARSAPKLSEKDHAQHWAGRVGVPGDIASMVMFLISSESTFVTGANFVVDGGMTRKMIYEE